MTEESKLKLITKKEWHKGEYFTSAEVWQDAPDGAPLMDWIAAVLAAIPEEYREFCCIDIEADRDDDDHSIVIEYKRLATAEEIAAEIERDKLYQLSVQTEIKRTRLRNLTEKYPEEAKLPLLRDIELDQAERLAELSTLAALRLKFEV